MKYSEILPDVIAGKWVRNNKKHMWMVMNEKGLWSTSSDATGGPISREAYELDTWEVKPYKYSYTAIKKEPPMNLLQAVEQGKIVGDDMVILKNPSEELRYNSEDSTFYDDNGEPQLWGADAWLTKDFEIIKPEPKVLTADEYTLNAIEDYNQNDPETNMESYIFSGVSIKKAFESGELKEWLNHKELRDEIERISQEKPGEYNFTDLYNIFERLNPPNIKE